MAVIAVKRIRFQDALLDFSAVFFFFLKQPSNWIISTDVQATPSAFANVFQMLRFVFPS